MQEPPINNVTNLPVDPAPIADLRKLLVLVEQTGDRIEQMADNAYGSTLCTAELHVLRQDLGEVWARIELSATQIAATIVTLEGFQK